MSILFSLALLLAPSVKSETATFTIYQAGAKVGTEEFTISARLGGYLAEGVTRMAGDPSPIKSRMELDEKLNPTSYEYEHGPGIIRIKIESPLSHYETIAAGKASSFDFQFPEGGFIVDNNFFHHYLLLLYKVSAESSFSIFVPQDLSKGSAKITPKGNRTFALEMGDVRLEATTDAEGRLIRLTVPEAKVVVER
jgi:hypothetical protein